MAAPTDLRPTTLVVDDVIVQFGDARLLDRISLELAPGEIVSIIGANGAGKTTLLDAISATVPLHQGSVTINKRTTGKDRAGSRNGVGRCFQGSPLPETMTIGEVVALVSDDQAQAEQTLERFGLTPHATSFVSELSTGMRRVLDLATATAGEPTILILDEPASGLAVSEVEHLARLIRGWRDETGGSVLVVEHDQQLVRAVADRVIVLEAGRMVAEGTAEEILVGSCPEISSVSTSPTVWASNTARERIRRADDPAFSSAMETVAADASVPYEIERRVLSTWTLLRLGLREFAAGMGSVLILGVLNRVMKVELGISLAAVSAILASYNIAAPLALAVGHRSDSHPIMGRNRTPYIIGGSIITALAVAGAPHIAGMLADGLTPISVGLAVILFVSMGFGMYGSGTVFFALIADIAPARERGHAASIVYFEMMFGILAGVALTTSLVDDHGTNLTVLFSVVAVLIVTLTTIAVWGQEDKVLPPEFVDPDEVEEEYVPFLQAAKQIAGVKIARDFFIFMVATTVFLFLQQAVLEPYGGEVLGLSVRQTSVFNAVMTIGILIGMLVGGRSFAQRHGHHKMAKVGLWMSIASFAFLSLSAFAAAEPPSWLAIFGLGLSTGIFNVAGLALMMGMAHGKHVALFMGAWTAAHAIADGTATAGGGFIYEITHWLTGSMPGGYGTVFAIEAIGLVFCLPLLARVSPERFAEEFSKIAEAEAEAAAEREAAAGDPTADVEAPSEPDPEASERVPA